ncbi:MAG: hypothetical protein ACLFUQ_06180 [Candidatus Izemoplasmataceae bacterium]
MKPLIQYDLYYMRRTSKIIIMLGLGIFLVALSVVTAKYMNELMALAFAQEGIEGIDFPEPTIDDAYTQFYSNMQQIFFLVFIFIAGAFFSRDFTKNIDQWLFSRPVNKTHYLLSRTLIIHALGLTALVVSGGFFLYSSYFLFPGVEGFKFLLSMGIFYVFILFFTQFLLMLVTLFGRMLWPMLITIVMLFVLSIFSSIDQGTFKYIPSRLASYALEYLVEDVPANEVLIASAVGLGFAVLFTLLATLLLKKQYYAQ